MLVSVELSGLVPSLGLLVCLRIQGGKIRLIRGSAVRRIHKNVPLRVLVKTGTPALRAAQVALRVKY